MGSISSPSFVSIAPPSPSVRQAIPKPIADRNVHNVVLGDVLFKTWYPSFYPEELVGRDLERLYICQRCFKYSKELMPFLAHVKSCTSQDLSLPGNLIYAKASHTIYELFTQNLSLFAKLFLDNKSVFFDVASFNYYLLVHTPSITNGHPPMRQQIVGFFSKEKMSWDNNNLACILIFPPWQRKGFGKILMGISYELSKREGRIGGPEKPLSELGRRGYVRFWEARVAKAVLGMKAKTTMTVGEIADVCWILPEDVILALKETGALLTKKKADGSAVVSKAKIREWVNERRIDLTPPVSGDGFLDPWEPEDVQDDGS
ncbi:hypothetical protein MMC07_000469 [Pseudocyphellaria aurata]|nr:hypothetical protein [Pseudocyphellaria aurata]